MQQMETSRNIVCPFVRAICPQIIIRKLAHGLQQSLIHMLYDRTPHNIHSFLFSCAQKQQYKLHKLTGASESSAIPELRQML